MNVRCSYNIIILLVFIGIFLTTVRCVNDCGVSFDYPSLDYTRAFDFTIGEVNKAQKVSFQITNHSNPPGRWDITIKNIIIIDDDNKAFSIVSAPKTPFVLKNGEKYKDKEEITIQFMPKEIIYHRARVEITWNAQDTNIHKVMDKDIKGYIELIATR